MKKLLFAIAFISLITSCTKIIELDLNDEDNKRLVVDARISSLPQEHVVRLSYSANYFSNEEEELVSGATVTITDGTKTIVFTEKEPGVYVSDSTEFGTPNMMHTLNIDVDGNTYTAEDYLDEPAILDSIRVVPYYEDNDPNLPQTEWDILFATQEKPGFGDYYAWSIYINGELYNPNIGDQLASSDEFLPDGAYFPMVYLDIIDLDDVESGDTVTVAQHTISELTFDSYQAILFQTDFRGGIFDSPPANIQTNLNNRAVGLFSATGESRASFVMP